MVGGVKANLCSFRIAANWSDHDRLGIVWCEGSLKRLTPRRGVHQFQTGHFLGVPGESGDLRRDLFFKEGGDVVYLTATS
ncbi:hypothetical protein TNCT_329321 [Trichonephila clavata]|uniref:Uncharacterized protein n=1 Tax=Trichonephila clavata TaxID=2740835 RepID=A0A8X6HL92_TRICU|nr:hypothetical protein TNCT_329321 [Trichonephila clavata]